MTRYSLAISTIGFAIIFNIPYSILASIFDYPGILRRPAGEVLTRFADGGAPLILTWHGFMLAALLLLPLAIGLSLKTAWLKSHPALAIGAVIAGSLAALTQAIGLSRWVFVIPQLAQTYVNPASSEATRSGAEAMFAVLNLYGGVAIGEHLGQWLTALFVVLVASLQFSDRSRLVACLGFISALAIALGTGEGVAIAIGHSGDSFSAFTTAGFLLLTAWLITTGIAMLRRPALQIANGAAMA